MHLILETKFRDNLLQFIGIISEISKIDWLGARTQNIWNDNLHLILPFKHQPPKMVKHTQTIRR